MPCWASIAEGTFLTLIAFLGLYTILGAKHGVRSGDNNISPSKTSVWIISFLLRDGLEIGGQPSFSQEHFHYSAKRNGYKWKDQYGYQI